MGGAPYWPANGGEAHASTGDEAATVVLCVDTLRYPPYMNDAGTVEQRFHSWTVATPLVYDGVFSVKR